ncbi:pulmonary surfactant-associated protein A2-like [Oxyura jamaicensis]|uniref:pulmonary surfactant-associated protein A2-like n=1 Tax=Oxyura jamaicensis TaxID=8884 RepID=UPI0015A5E20C|nr:pulmonary surfactant-associated protein A2-like [Oxyura jamaicensis]
MMSYSFCMLTAAAALLVPCHALNCPGLPELSDNTTLGGLLRLLEPILGPTWPFRREKLPEPQVPMGLQGLPISRNTEFSDVLVNFRQRLSRLEGALTLNGKITKAGEKILASNGKKVTFSSALESCEQTGGTLATPMNKEENKAILRIVEQYNTNAYLGIKESETSGQFEYMNGTPLNYTNWYQYEPNGKGTEKCVEMYTNGNWNDRKCNLYRLTICEF